MTLARMMRLQRIFQSKGMRLGGFRLALVFLAIRGLLWLLGVDREFVGITLYLEGVGTMNGGPGGKTDDLGNNQFALKLWVQPWP